MLASIGDRLLALPAGVALCLVFLLPALESSVFLGFVFPGEIAVIIGGVLASQGKFPLWMAPLQAVVATITGEADAWAGKVQVALGAAGLRAESDLRNEKINYKVREHSLAKVPNLLVVGKREADEGTVALRQLGSERQQVLSLAEAIERLQSEAMAPDRT